MELKFRKLRADEIDARLAMVKPNGASVLLYKDARCDMNILDESVGAFNWKRHHSRENANCTVSIWDKDKEQWIDKEDTGTESNTEAEKGLASDSFKRACFNWGIGRELYTAPFIWFKADEIKLSGNKCYDKFRVDSVSYNGNCIQSVTVTNTSTNVSKVFTNGSAAPKKTRAKAEPKASAEVVAEITSGLLETNSNIEAFMNLFGISDVKDITAKDAEKALEMINKKRGRS